jgi:hypothetical protein
MNNQGDDWGNLDNLSDEDATRIWGGRNNWVSDPANEGQTFNKGGTTYVLTAASSIEHLSGDNRRIVVKAINTETGVEEVVYASSKFEPWF